MKTRIKRIGLGLISSLMLALGFNRAADRLDPLGYIPPAQVRDAVAQNAADDCDAMCRLLDENLS
jgi:hypothetical protein